MLGFLLGFAGNDHFLVHIVEGIGFEAGGGDGVDGDVGGGEEAGGFLTSLGEFALRGGGVGEVLIGEEGEGKGARKPDDVFAAGNAGKIVGELLKCFEGER
jgi:hypothetical protein